MMQPDIRDCSEDLYAVLIDKTECEVNRRLIGTNERAKQEMKDNGKQAGDAGLKAYLCLVLEDNRTPTVRENGSVDDSETGKVG